MSRDWFAEWLECANEETLDEFVERMEANVAAMKQQQALTPYLAQIAGIQQPLYAQLLAANAQNAGRAYLGFSPLGSIAGALGGLL